MSYLVHRHVAIPAVARLHAHHGTAAGNWWEVAGVTCVAAYQAKGAVSYAASKTNLANPGTYDAVDGAAYPAWATETGWTCDGSTTYLTTGIVHAEGWTLIARGTPTNFNAARLMCGARTDATTRLHVGVGLGPTLLLHHGGTLIKSTGTNGQNYVLAATAGAGYIDGVDQGAPGAWSGTNTRDAFIGSDNPNGAPNYHWLGTIQAVAWYSSTLSDTQVATVSSAMAAL